MPLYEYYCADHHTTEVVSSFKNKQDIVKCSECGKDAFYTISRPSVHLEGVSGDFPGAAMKWNADHYKRAKAHRD